MMCFYCNDTQDSVNNFLMVDCLIMFINKTVFYRKADLGVFNFFLILQYFSGSSAIFFANFYYTKVAWV